MLDAEFFSPMPSSKLALIVQGGWSGHEPDLCAGVVETMLAREGFEVTIQNDPEAFSDPELKRYDLIVPIYSHGTISQTASQNLSEAVVAGTGLAGFHGGMGDSFRSDTNYQFMTGGQWVAHPGNIINYRVNIVDKTDPVTAGLADFDYVSEQYYMHVDPSNQVLATTTFSGEYCAWIKGVVMPVVWKRQHGQGKVFYSSLGHQVAEFRVPEMYEIFRRGALWAAR
jgi:uncharacterized protein